MAISNSQETQSARYKLLELIEEGISGKLFRAHDAQTDRRVLLKVLPRQISQNPDFQRYVHDRWSARGPMLEHPNIAHVLDVGKKDDRFYIAIEDVPGERLADRLAQAPIDPDDVVDIVRQIAEALRAAERHEMIHGHLKPTDVFLTQAPGGKRLVKVLFLDLGVSAQDSMMSVFGELQGSPKYMAPEVIRGQIPTAQGDLFALGVIAYELLTGVEPFPSRHTVGYLFANCEGALTPVRDVRETPHEVAAVVERLVAQDPERRYGSAQRLIDDLDRCVESVKTGSVSVVPAGTDSAFARTYALPTPDAAARRARRAPMSVAGVMALVVSLLALGIVGYVGYEVTRYLRVASVTARTQPEPLVVPQDVAEPEDETSREPERDDPARLRAVRERKAAHRLEVALKEWETRYSLTGQFDSAATGFRSVAADYPETPQATEALGLAAKVYTDWAEHLLNPERQHADPLGVRLDQAEQHCRAALATAPENSRYYGLAMRQLPGILARRADYAYRRGLYDKAIETYGAIAEEFPASTEAGLLAEHEPSIRYDSGFRLWKTNGRLDAALAEFQHVARQYPGSKAAADVGRRLPELHLDIAKAHVGQKRLNDAIEALANLRLRFPDTASAREAGLLEADLLYRLYATATREGNARRADALFERLTSEYPTHKATQRAARRRLGLLPDAGVRLWSTDVAKRGFVSAGEAFAAMHYGKALGDLRAIIRNTPEDNPIGVQAMAALPEWTYQAALRNYGVGQPQTGKADLERLADEFGHTRWAERARTDIARFASPPEGMVYVPEGLFAMGSTPEALVQILDPYYKMIRGDQEARDLVFAAGDYASELGRHVALTRAFFIDRTEVTHAQYKAFLDKTGRDAPSHWKEGVYPAGRDNLPVTGVTIHDARAYAASVGKRLPTEAEWEKAARGPDGRTFTWGRTFTPRYAHALSREAGGPRPVGSFAAGASPYGCLDMIGNVWELTESSFEPYEGNEIACESVPYGKDRIVARGGAWYADGTDGLPIPPRCAVRRAVLPTESDTRTGFRCVRDVPPE